MVEDFSGSEMENLSRRSEINSPAAGTEMLKTLNICEQQEPAERYLE